MKTQTNPIPPEEPNLSALPAPDPLQIANERAAEFEAKFKETDKWLKDALEIIKLRTAKLEVTEKNPLFFALLHLDEGAVVEEMGEKLKGLCEAVGRLDDKGSLTIKIKVKTQGTALVLSAESKVSTPEPESFGGIFYRGKDGRLSREDARQQKLDFKGGSRGDRSDPHDQDAYADERE